MTLSTAWQYTHDPLAVQLDSHGIRQFDLDVHYCPGKPFALFHVPGSARARTTERSSSACLRQVHCLWYAVVHE